MKKSLFYLAAFAAVLSACAKEIEPANNDQAENTIPSNKETIVIYGSVNPLTKTTVDGSGIFAWQASETIAVVEQDMTDSDGTPFSLSDASTGAFTGTKTDGKDLVFAVSPASALREATEDSGDILYTLTLPTTYSGYVAGTTNAVMVGVPDNEYTGDGYKFIFSHVAALLKFTYANVPYGTKKFKLTTPENITGEWVFDETSGISLDQAGADAKSVTITLASTVESVGQTMSFYVPVPAGNYTGFSIELQDAAGNTLSGTNKTKTSLDIDLEAGDIFPCPTITLPAESLASLDYSTDGIASIITTKYNDPHNVDNASGTWVVCAYKNSGMQLNTDGGKVSYITIPTLMGNIKKVVVTGTYPTRYYMNNSNSATTGGVAGTEIDGKSYIDVSAKSWSTAHIVSSGAAIATHVDVIYTAKEVDHITLTTSPTKTSYTYGDAFDFSGAVVTAYFKDDTNADVTSFVTTDGADVVASAGDGKTVTISYGGKTTTFTIDVAKAEAGLEYATAAYNVVPNAEFATPSLTNPFGVSVTYSSSNTSLVTVNASTGAVTIGSSTGGPVTITASTTGNANVKAGEASYTITISSGVKLSKPAGVSLTVSTTNTLTATWSTVASASGYTWIISTADDENDIAPANTVASGDEDDADLSSTTYTLDKSSLSLTQGTTYYFYVQANGTGGYSDSDYETDHIKVLLIEEFDNDSSSDSNTVITSATFSNFSGTTSYAYKGAHGDLKLGSSSKAGKVTSKTLDLSEDFTVLVDVTKYSSDSGKLNVKVGSTIEEITPPASKTQFSIDFDAATSTSTVEFSTTSKRAYIDNVIIICK